jgi:hypothetical protein
MKITRRQLRKIIQETVSDLDFPEHSSEYVWGFEDGYRQQPPETDDPEYVKGYNSGNKLGAREERWDAREEHRMRNRGSHLTEQSQDKNAYRSYLEDLIPDTLVPEESKERFFREASSMMSKECSSLIDADGIKDEMKLKACAAKSMTFIASKLALVEVVQWIAVKLGNLVYGGLPHE